MIPYPNFWNDDIGHAPHHRDKVERVPSLLEVILRGEQDMTGNTLRQRAYKWVTAKKLSAAVISKNEMKTTKIQLW